MIAKTCVVTSLLAVAATAHAATAHAAAPAGGAATDAAPIATWHGDGMFEDFSVRTQVSPDAQWILRTSVDGNETLLSLPGLQPSEAVLRGGLDSLERLVFCGAHGFLRLGTRGGTHAWFGPGTQSESGPATAIPAQATPACSLDGTQIAHFTSYPPRRELPPPTEIHAGTAKGFKKIALGSVVTGAVYSSDGKTLYPIARQADGASSVFAIDVQSGKIRTVARDLDAWPFAGVNIAIAPGDTQLIVALGSLHKPDDAERQKPIANHWLAIASVDSRTGRLGILRPAAGHDHTDPSIAGNNLYWVNISVTKAVEALPAAGGPSHAVISGSEGYHPSWSRDGKRIAYVVGQYRLVDWALSQDVAIVDVDSNARPTSKPKMFVEGNHEDFPVDWSPNGKWIVWHSHRDPHKNPAYYDAPGVTDEIWIRAAEDTHAPERPLTHGLWETGWAYWSPDGHKVIYTSWDRDGEPGKFHAAVTNVDPDSGKILGSERLKLPKEIHSPQVADWSPDGQEIAVEDASGPRERTLWIVSARLDSATKVVSYPSETYGGVSWMPDGKSLVFAAIDQGHMQIYSVSRTGAGMKRLSDGQGNLVNPRVSPDGKWIACSRIDTVQTLETVAWHPGGV